MQHRLTADNTANLGHYRLQSVTGETQIVSDMQHMMKELGQEPLAVLAGSWDLRLGYHPSLMGYLPILAEMPVFAEAAQAQRLAELELPVSAMSNGHHLLKDSGPLAAGTPPGGVAEAVDAYPLAPVFVRDLCGRPIHTGLVPLPAAPSVPLFPQGCRHVPHNHPVYPLLENVVFVGLRRMECLPVQPQAGYLAGQSHLQLRHVTARPQDYAYKLRPDTFYADGWRLPVVPRVFAVPVPPVQALAAAEEFLARWKTRPEGQDYEAFYDANNGDEWFEELFEKGCTVVPTLEAYNGRYHVGADYVATAVDPGRALVGLHDIVGEQASDLPKGTIVQVQEPGWVTATQIQPAKVIVSDGSGFQKPEAPEPLLPNLAYPHPRIGGTWGDVWLPTHPAHFAEPALYDWNATGHFVQISGPLWDPLHYVYTSTEPLLRTLRKPHPEVAGGYQLPASLKMKFHPLAPQTWFDALNERTAQQRMQDPLHPLYGSAVDAVPMLGKHVVPVGYQPLPWQLEYELDPAHMPARSPQHLGSVCPPNVKARLAPYVKLENPDVYVRHNVTVGEPMRQALAEAMAAPRNEAECDENGTQLPRQLQTQAENDEWALPCWLPEMPASHLAINVKRLFAARNYRQALQDLAKEWQQPALPSAFYQFREAALAWRRLRYRMFTKYAAVWQQAAVEGIDIVAAEALVPESLPQHHAAVMQARSQALGVVATVPLQRADGLRSEPAQAKLVQAGSQRARKVRKSKNKPDNNGVKAT